MDTRILAHFIFIGETGLPSLYQQCINSFQQKHPGWKIKLWTTRDANKILLEKGYDPSINDTFINRYNFVKYNILAEEGGWFVDLDIKWKRSINEIYTDKLKNKNFPDIFIPVRQFPRERKINYNRNDDMLLYAKKGVLNDLLSFIDLREDIDYDLRYEPYGPVSLSKWIHSTGLDRVYLFEDEIQENGYYCEHKNNLSWKFS
jgi:hypothetical protein